MINKEYGSYFSYVTSEKWRSASSKDSFFDDKNFSFYFSGRSALYAILKYGIENKGWHTVLVPSYFCHEVNSFIQSLSISIEYYEITPFNEGVFSKTDWVDNEGTAIVIVNHFGISKIDYSFIKKAAVIEDLTHNLEYVKESNADYVFGSLRKILPIPVGGFCYTNNTLDSLPVNIEAENMSMAIFSAMYLKHLYLNGDFCNKEIFRNIYLESEEKFEDEYAHSALPIMVKDYLESLRIHPIIEAKKKNLLIAKSLLRPSEHFNLITNKENSDFALTLKFKTNIERENHRNYLITHNIYPIVLWPNQFLESNKKFQETILFIHIDFRYNEQDIIEIIKILNNYQENV